MPSLKIVECAVNDALLPNEAGAAEHHSILVQHAFTAIDAATSTEEVKKVLAEWAGVAAYARKAKDKQLEADAAEIKMRAERRIGEMMQAQKEAVGFHKGGGDQRSDHRIFEKTGDLPTLAEAGIDKNLANSARKEAAKSEEQFEEDVAEKKSGILEGKGKLKAMNPEPLSDGAGNYRRKDGQVDRRHKDGRNARELDHLEKFRMSISFVRSAAIGAAELKFPPNLTAEMATEAAKNVDEAIEELCKLKARLVTHNRAEAAVEEVEPIKAVFDGLVLLLIEMARKAKPERFAATVVHADELMKLGEFFPKVASVRLAKRRRQ